MLPILPQILDKENSGTPQRVSVYKDDPQGSDEATRTPLQPINQLRGLQKAQYGQITPMQTPAGKTPRRKAAGPKVGQLTFPDSENVAGAAGNPMLNSLVYKLVAEKVEEKNQEIQQLHEFYKSQLSSVERNTAVVETGTQIEENKSNPEVIVGQQFQFSDASSVLVEEDDEVEHVESACSPIRFDGGEEASYFNAVDMETWMTPIKTLDTSQLTSPVIQVDKAIESKVESCEVETETDKIQTISRSAMTMTVVMREEGVGTEHKEYSDSHTSVTPVKLSNMSTTYTPVKQIETETAMTPVSYRTMMTQKTPVRSTTMETAMTPIHHATTETVMTPVNHVTGFTEMTPVRQVAMATDMTPVKFHSECVGTESVESVDVGTCTLPVPVTECETNTSPVKTKEVGMKTELISQVEATVNTSPIKTLSVNTMVTPVKTRHTETSMLPVVVLDCGVGTDPPPYLCDASTQISADHTDCVQKEYKELYQEYRQKLRKAEVQLEVYLNLKKNMDETSAHMAQVYQAIHKANDVLKERKERYHNEHAEWEKQHEEWKEKMEENDRKMKEISEERNQMASTHNEILERKHDAEQALKQKCDMYIETVNKLEQLTTEMNEMRTKYSKMKETYRAITSQLTEMEKTRDENLVRSEAMAADVQLLQNKLSDEESRANTAEKQLDDMSKRHDQELTNLRRYIESKMYEACAMEKELKVRLTSTIESKEFLEQENQVAREDLLTAQSNITQLLRQIAVANEEAENRTKQINDMTEQNEKLRQEILALEDELDHTKANAHLLLLDQNTEISQTIAKLGALSQRVNVLDREIEEKVSEWTAMSSNSPVAEVQLEEQLEEKSSVASAKKTEKRHDRRSFLDSVMKAINRVETPPSANSAPSRTPIQVETENVDEDSSEDKVLPRVVIGSSEGSAFERVQPSPPSPSESPASQKSFSSQDSDDSSSSSKALFEQVDDINSVVVNIMMNLKLLGETVKNRVSKLQNNIEHLKAEGKTSHREHGHTVRRLSGRINDLNLQIKELEGINKVLKESINKNKELLPQKAQEKCARLEGELSKFHEKLQSQTEKNKILCDLLDSKVEECSDENQKKLIKDNVALKKELQQWRRKFYKEQEQFESKVSKLKLTAQQEMESYHAAYDDLRKIILKHSAVAMLWPEREELEDLGALAPGSPNFAK